MIISYVIAFVFLWTVVLIVVSVLFARSFVSDLEKDFSEINKIIAEWDGEKPMDITEQFMLENKLSQIIEFHCKARELSSVFFVV